nr:enhanced ethylene response protein 5 [Tanacetum cinerariifolium]
DANRLIRQADKYSQYAEIVAPLFRAMQSYRADRELASNGKTPEKLKAAGSFLMKVFGVLA